MGMWERRFAGTGRSRAFAAVVGAALALATPTVARGAYAPSPEEYALLALANAERAERGIAPLVWNDDLGRAARAHSDDMAVNGCRQHDSCNGEAWWKRIGRYYPGWIAVGENIGGGGYNPPLIHGGWMASSGHRANILGTQFTEFGAGVSYADLGDGSYEDQATEDFGSRGSIPPSSIPRLPAGGVFPRQAFASDPRQLIVNYFAADGRAPLAVRALVGPACVSLPRTHGTAGHGSYGTSRLFPNEGCTPVVFEAIDAGGTRHRWPANKAIVVGTGWASLNCTEFTTAVPTQDCGGPNVPGEPSPTPTPGPTPGDSALSSLRVILQPGKKDASRGQVRIDATLPADPSFDPTSGPVSLEARVGSLDWSRTLPRLCAGNPCLKANARRTTYRARYDDGATLSLVRTADGRWKLRFASRRETLGAPSAGTVAVSVTVDGQAYDGAVAGKLMRTGRLVAR